MMQEEDSVSQQNVQQNISNRPESPLEEDDSIQESGINKIQSEKQIKTIQHKSNSYSIDGGEDSKREIHLAAVKGDEKYMRDIIQRGGNLHVQTKKGETALHLAARYDHDLIVNDLMLNGGVSSIKDKNGQTPLHVACANGAHGAAKVLLNFQADLTVKDKDGMAPLHLAAKYNKPQIIEIVGRRKGDLQIRVPHNMQAPIHVAVEHGSQAAMEALVAHGANPNLRAWSGQSPLHVAVEHGQSQLIAPLIARGAVINQRLTNGRSTPLTLAIDKDQLECIKELLKVAQEAGKLQEILGQRARDAHMWLPIHVAVYSGKREAVKLLVAAGADLQTQDYYRFSCLHLAAECDDPQMVKLLLSYGVDVNEHRLTDNWSALHQAAAFCSHNAAEALLEAGAKPNVLTCGVMFGFMRQRPIHVVGHNCRDQRKIIAMRALLQKYEVNAASAPYNICTRRRLNKKFGRTINKVVSSSSGSSTTSTIAAVKKNVLVPIQLIRLLVFKQTSKGGGVGVGNRRFSDMPSWGLDIFSDYGDQNFGKLKQGLVPQKTKLEIEMQPWSLKSEKHSDWRKFMLRSCVS